MMRLRTKIVEIEAVLWTGNEDECPEVFAFVPEENIAWRGNGMLAVFNDLEYQWINVPDGHYILRGLRGEYYPCEPEALFMKYEVISD
jgi:hypothetical protein